MPLITIPNVSEGRDEAVVRALAVTLRDAGCTVLDVHSDPVHNRSVFTATGSPERLVGGLSALAAEAAHSIDLQRQDGVHPRVGALDVCPIVPHDAAMADAVEVARGTGAAIAAHAGIPVYLYDEASPDGVSLPELRAGGLHRLIERAAAGFSPDLGPARIDPAVGVVCVGARGPLIAFNVYLVGTKEAAAAMARCVRERDGGLPGVRALGLELTRGLAQVSMNLVDPDRTGIEEAFAVVAGAARASSTTIVQTELVGLVPERYLPAPDAQATRLLREPGRSLEAALES